MFEVFGSDGSVNRGLKVVGRAFKSGGVSVGISSSVGDDGYWEVFDACVAFVKRDVGGFVFDPFDDGVSVGELCDDVFSGRVSVRDKVVSVVGDRNWSVDTVRKFDDLCLRAGEFGCLVLVGYVEGCRVGGGVDFNVGAPVDVVKKGAVAGSFVSSGSSVGRLGSGSRGSFNGGSGSRGSSLLGRWRS